MTAIYMAVASNGVLMMSDGAAYDEDGVLRQIHTKQLVATDISLVMSASGSGPMLDFIRLYLSRENPLSFDEVHARMPEILREMICDMDRYFNKKNYAAILYGGFSEELGKYVGYLILSYDGPYLEVAAFTPVAMSVFAKPNASAEMFEFYDLGNDAYERLGPMEYGRRLMLAVRKSPFELHGPNTGHGYGVGGYVEQTFLQREVANTQILWRWPDEIGLIIDPSNDPAIPINATDPSGKPTG